MIAEFDFEEFKATLPENIEDRNRLIYAEIARHTKIMNDNTGVEQASKVMLNSIYGAIASPYFTGFNTDVAEAITLQGQDLIKYSETITNKYFLSIWHLDRELHEKLGITVFAKIENEVTLYIDTDSLYINFQLVMQTMSGWTKSGEELVLAIYECRLKEYYQKCFTVYAKKRNTENLQDFELELIARSTIWLAKKKYVLNTTWKDPGIFQKNLSKVKFKGIEVVQSSTPLFSRKKIVDLIKYMLDPDVDFNAKEFALTLKKAKEEFKLSTIDDISKGGKIGDYEKYVLNDTTAFTLNSGCPIHIRAAGWYNYNLNSNKLKSKYLMIRTGDKTKWYFTKDKDQDVFAYLPNNFPLEFAPEIDYDKQFSSVMLDTVNRFLKAIGKPELPANLVTVQQLF